MVNLYCSTKFHPCTFDGSIPIWMYKINMEISMTRSKNGYPV